MPDIPTEDAYLQLVLHRNEQTTPDFVAELVRSVFSRSASDAEALTATIGSQGKAVCGTYPRAVAEALLAAANQRIESTGQALLITAEPDDDEDDDDCRLCGGAAGGNEIGLAGKTVLICHECTLAIANNTGRITRDKPFKYACEALDWHFAGIAQEQMVATSRQFPGHMRADVQGAIDRLFSASPIRFFGIHEQQPLRDADDRGADAATAAMPTRIAPAQYHEVEIGESAPVKCLNNGLWLCRAGEMRYAVVLSAHREYGHEAGIRVEIAVPAGAAGAEFVQRCFSELESAVNAARCYRGKILSLDADADYRGRSRGVTVHKLPPVRARRRDPARGDAEAARPQRPEFCRQPPTAAPARAIDPQGHPALRAARNRQDPHHPLSRQQPARPHHPDHHRGAGRAAGAIHELWPACCSRRWS